MSPDLYIVGTGIVSYKQMTREAEQAIQDSRKVFILHMQEEVKAAIRSLNAEIVDLSTEYKEGRERNKIYQRMANQVLEAVEDSDNPICFALYGHPLVFFNPSRRLLRIAEEKNLEVEVMPGVSSIDNIYTELPLDPGENGIQIFEATEFLLNEYSISSDVPLLLLQVGMLDTTLYEEPPDFGEKLNDLKELLGRHYPENHNISLIWVASKPSSDSVRREFSLRDLDEKRDIIGVEHTLYIPPVSGESG